MPAARRTTTTQHPERYTDPDLRQQIKDDITNSDKGRNYNIDTNII